MRFDKDIVNVRYAPVFVSMHQHACISAHQCASVCISMHQLASVCISMHQYAQVCRSMHQHAYVSMHQHASACASMHQHASVCIIIESAYNLYIESPLSLLHAMWCPDGIGRESWVWVVAPSQGESMTPPPPQWGGVRSSTGSHRREQTERP